MGAIVGFLVSLLFFRKLICFYTYMPSGKILLGVLSGLWVLVGFLVKPLEANLNKNILVFLLGTVLVLVAGTFLSPIFMDVEINACVRDFDNLIALIQMEEKAVTNSDLSLIEEIYEPKAIVLNAEEGELYPVYLYYSQKFEKQEVCEVTHFGFQVESYTRDQKQVSMVSGSQGSWGDKGQGCYYPFYNPVGGDQWEFVKTERGWQISHFSFNNK